MKAAIYFLLMMSMISFSSKNDATTNTLGKGIQGYEIPDIRMHGLKIFVDDLSEAEAFYSGVLGFGITEETSTQLILKTNAYPLYIQYSDQPVERNVHKESHIGLTFQVSKLLPAIDALRAYGIEIADSLLSRNGVGIDIPFYDPAGNILHLMEVQIREVPGFEGYIVYNSGAVVRNMTEAEYFYKNGLGFLDWSRDYLPSALPLKHKDGSFAFMLHEDKTLIHNNPITYGVSPQIVLVYSVSSLYDARKYFQEVGIHFMEIEGNLVLSDKEGNYVEVIES